MDQIGRKAAVHRGRKKSDMTERLHFPNPWGCYFGECNELGTQLDFFPDVPSIVLIFTFLSHM